MNQLYGSRPMQLIPSMALAALVTFSLFYFMMTLIRANYELIDDPAILLMDFVRIPEERTIPDSRPQAKEPPEPEMVPPLPQVAFNPTDVRFTIQTTKPVDTPIFEKGSGFSEGAYLPLVKVQPTYPRNALSRSIQGYTIVEFDVGPDGSVRNPRVIEYSPSPIFNESSLRAVMKFRYKPSVENGIPVMVTGVQNRFTFELEGG